jgi:hypothetical protein
MSRFAIGYSPHEGQLDRALMVFVETGDGVLVQERGKQAPRLLNRSMEARSNGGPARSVAPGEPAYFDMILDGFSTSVFIRTIAELEPDVLASMLVAEENWDLLPRPGVHGVPA